MNTPSVDLVLDQVRNFNKSFPGMPGGWQVGSLYLPDVLYAQLYHLHALPNEESNTKRMVFDVGSVKVTAMPSSTASDTTLRTYEERNNIVYDFWSNRLIIPYRDLLKYTPSSKLLRKLLSWFKIDINIGKLTFFHNIHYLKTIEIAHVGKLENLTYIHDRHISIPHEVSSHYATSQNFGNTLTIGHNSKTFKYYFKYLGVLREVTLNPAEVSFLLKSPTNRWRLLCDGIKNYFLTKFKKDKEFKELYCSITKKTCKKPKYSWLSKLFAGSQPELYV